ncbi:Protein of unknown function DUF58 [Neorhodopirellula lusitana]|uniref:DUF58 domain-containing protein n=1 Tax=Neorhodopirellula lusitana TaxID=445327 RepID=A0ABY1QUT5_9BACT|nr:DUF58 domain-containing protein [Neorhodopirellula lusitana]SMP78476.1 Protein of unknown function DUF58 [Neorhodopirellula lusitana]
MVLPNRNSASKASASDLAAKIDPGAVMRIKNLQLRAKTVVEGFFNGLHRSPLHGSSVEFSEYRPYTIGDDLRGLDWKRYARSDRYYIKKFEDETSRNGYLVVDQSQSMGFGSLEYTKIDYARTLAATFAYFLTLQRDCVGLMTFDEAIADYIPARRRVGHLRQLLVALSRPVSGTGTDINVPLQQIANLVHRRGLVLLISDLLSPVESLRTNLAYLRSRGHEVALLRTLDPSELDFHLDAPSMVQDIETGQEFYLDPETAKSDYQERFSEHQAQLQNVCDSLGVDLYTISTREPLQDSLFHLLDSRQRQTRGTARSGMIARAATGLKGAPS